jgi:hypothetical protein
MMLVSTVDIETMANTKCAFAAGLQADVPVAERAAIEAELRRHHPAPVLEDVTDLPADVRVTWALPSSSTGWTVVDETTRAADGLYVVLTTDAAGVQAMQRILATIGVHGSAAFTLGDGQRVDAEVHLQLDRIVGPPSTGPVTAQLAGPAVRLHNRIESPVAVLDVVADTVAGPAAIAVDAVLAAGETRDVPVPDGTTAAVPVTHVQATAATLEEVRAYVEDITFEVRFLSVVDLAAAGLTGLAVTASMEGDPHEQRLELRADRPSGTLTFVSPLTRAATERGLRFRVHRLGDGGAELGVSAPFAWQLDDHGYVITLTAAHLSDHSS